MNENSPIFVRGLSRSGGTLLVTILDAHSDIAMSYELYPNLLRSLTEGQLDTDDFLEILSGSRKGKRLERNPKYRQLQIFINRCPRSGIERENLTTLIEEHLSAGDGFGDLTGCLRFIERCAVKKMKNEGKSQWGLKCSNNFQAYLKVWPRARFLNMVRDGRDVLASQLNTGSFNKTPIEVGKGWTHTLNKFLSLIQNPEVRAYEVFYERLVREPEEEVRRICEFLEVPFYNAMLSFYQRNLTIYKSPKGHLSINRITKPVDTSKIGRWKKELTDEELDEFYSIAKETLIKFGYLQEESNANGP